jgi:hypothetical protein
MQTIRHVIEERDQSQGKQAGMPEKEVEDGMEHKGVTTCSPIAAIPIR